MSSSRLSFRPRPLDIHKKLPVIKSVKEFEDEDMHTPHRVKIFGLSAEIDNEAHNPTLRKKLDLDIPTPQFVDVESYVRDYLPNFKQPTSYLRGKGARTEFGEYCEYDLDNEDDDWLHELNKERKILAPEKLESLLFKLEVLDHKARERAGVIAPTLGSPVYILLQFDSALEALQAQSITYGVFQAIFNYWKEKRDRWQKPILRRLQPPPPLTDTNPYNVFRPREKAHRLHTRRMQRRENNAHSFDKLRQVRRNLEQAKTVLEALIKREEKKRDVMESEVSLQRIQVMYKHESELLEDSLALPGFPSASCNFGSSEEDYVDSDDVSYIRPHSHSAAVHNQPFADIKPIILSTGRLKREFSRRQVPNGWLHKLDPLEPVLLFTKPLDPEKLSEAGISPPLDSSTKTNDGYVSSCKFRGRMGRGGRIVFDRWNALLNTPIDCGDSFYVPPKPRSTIYN